MDEHHPLGDRAGRPSGDGTTVDAVTADATVAEATVADATVAEATVAPDDVTEPVTVLGVDTAQHAQELLAEHVPLALLVDLLRPTETSAELLAAEGLPDDTWWSAAGDQTAPGA